MNSKIIGGIVGGVATAIILYFVTFGLNHVLILTVTPDVPDNMFVGESYPFSASVTGGIPNYKYVWDFGDGSPKSQDPNPTHVYNEAKNYVGTVSVSDSSINHDQKSFNVNVQVPDKPDITITTLSSTQFSDVGCMADRPIGAPKYQCGSVSTDIYNQGKGSANNCDLKITIKPQMSAPGNPNYEYSSQQFKLDPLSHQSLQLPIDYKYGNGLYEIDGKVYCTETTSTEQTTKIMVLHK